MPRVLFLSPPRRADGSRPLFNHASLTLASFLVRQGIEARMEPLVGPGWARHLEHVLADFRPDHAAISCKWWDTLHGATEVARRVKAQDSRIATLAGGQTATAFADELVRRGMLDAVVRGDGERPLLARVRGEPGPNLTWMQDGIVRTTEQTYVQRPADGEDLTLLDDLTEIADSRLLAWIGREVPFVWTGKGCRSTCLYCAGSALGHKRLFNRTGYVYRPIDQVIHDLEVFAPWSGGSFLFDFDPVTDPDKEPYYLELFSRLPRRRYHALFYCWSLPSRSFIERISDTFASAVVGLDAQTYSEPLRQRLAQRAWIKPFSSDDAILDRLAAIGETPNLTASVYGILGLATETAEDVRRAEEFLERIHADHGPHLHELALTPLSIEPGALVNGNPQKYGIVPLRHTLDDYLAHTGQAWSGQAGFHGQPWKEDGPHPFGLMLAGDAPDRVWRDYQRLQDRLAAMDTERHQARAMGNLTFTEDAVRLVLRNRTVFEPVWELLPWAVDNALAWERPQVHIEAEDAWIHVPDSETLTFDERFQVTVEGLGRVRHALSSGQARLHLETKQGQQWGAIGELPSIRMPS
ncbi:MAG: cobalamin-dependent protein [Candidatus Sericytochromatia bacterium]|nr:cobalamin-dependent protein [Candidatus Sericytochromatia bacterium]